MTITIQKSDITAVTKVLIEGQIAALIACDKNIAQERINFAFNQSNFDGDTSVTLHNSFGGARVIANIDGEPMGLLVGPWNVITTREHDELVIYKEDDSYGDVENIDLENEWIDLLMIVRNFFALERNETCDFARIWPEAA